MTVGAKQEAYLTSGGLSAYVTTETAKSVTKYMQPTIQILQKQT